MELIVLKGNLKEGLSQLGKVSSENLSLPILRNCLIETQDNKIKISSTNLEIAITSFISAKIINDGNITIPFSIFSSIINNLENERINLEVKNNNLIIKTENYEAKIQGIKKEEFPIIPKIENNSDFIEFNSNFLKEAFLSVINAAQISSNRPELGGILFDYQTSFIKLAATDSFRLAEKTVEETHFKTNIDNNFKIIIPLKTIQEFIRTILENNDDKIKIYFDQNQILFKSDKVEIISRIINGNFPDYQTIIPKKNTTEIIIEKNQLINALKLTGSFTDKLNEIKIKIKEDEKSIEIFSANPILGENQYLVPAKIKGFSIEVVFNWRYLFDGIKNIETENISIGLSSDDKPAILKPINNQDYFYIVMPIKS